MGADVAVTGKAHLEGATCVAKKILEMGRKFIAVRMDVSDYHDVKGGVPRLNRN